MFLDHFIVWSNFDRYKLILNKHDSSATIRYIYIDLTNQYQTQSNYLNDIVGVANYFNCNHFFVVVNKITPALMQNIPQDINIFFIDYNKLPEIDDCGNEFYYQTYYSEDDENYIPFGYVPNRDKFIDIQNFRYGGHYN